MGHQRTSNEAGILRKSQCRFHMREALEASHPEILSALSRVAAVYNLFHCLGFLLFRSKCLCPVQHLMKILEIIERHV